MQVRLDDLELELTFGLLEIEFGVGDQNTHAPVRSQVRLGNCPIDQATIHLNVEQGRLAMNRATGYKKRWTVG